MIVSKEGHDQILEKVGTPSMVWPSQVVSERGSLLKADETKMTILGPPFFARKQGLE